MPSKVVIVPLLTMSPAKFVTLPTATPLIAPVPIREIVPALVMPPETLEMLTMSMPAALPPESRIVPLLRMPPPKIEIKVGGERLPTKMPLPVWAARRL